MLKNNLKNIFDFYNYKLGNGHKLTKYQLSKQTDIPRTTINRLIRDPSASMNMKTINNLMEFFNVPVSKLLVYKRNPYRFKLMNATDIKPNHLTERVKSSLKYSVALRSVDYHQTIIFTPLIRNLSKKVKNFNYDSCIKIPYEVEYTDITKYPIYRAIQCSNTLNQLFKSVPFHFGNYITMIMLLHSGLISEATDKKLNTDFLELNLVEPKSTPSNFNHFQLSKNAFDGINISSGGIVINGKSNYGWLEANLIAYRKLSNKTKNGYVIKFPHVKLIDTTSIKYK